jgi:formylglycine-generating enzyme required for sulfatase activity
MVLVPAGEFICGFDRQRVFLPDFLIDPYSVTNEDYKRFVDATGHDVPFLDEPWAASLCWQNDAYPEGMGRHPVVLVSHDDAVEYARWARKRLPTHDEWEKASRGTDGRDYPWGDDFVRGNCNTRESGRGTTTDVDEFPDGVSPYRCFDMAGNAWDWTSTPESPGRFVIKGGSYARNCLAAQSAYRSAVPATHRGVDVGFRCARDPS